MLNLTEEEQIMEERYYKVDETVFKKLTKKWYRKKKNWKLLNLLHWIFIALGIGFVAYMIFQAMDPTVPDMEAQILIITVGLVYASFPFILAFVTANLARRYVGKPFATMRSIFLSTSQWGIRFGYHDCNDRVSAESAIVHQIPYESIHHVELNQADSMITVVGRTQRLEYENLVSGETRFEFTKGQFGDMAEFSFFNCFENQQAFFDELKARNVKIENS